MTRRWLPIGGAALLAVALAFGLWPSARPVETGKVTNGVLRVTVNEEGKTRIRHRFMVSAPVSGQLRRIALRAGDAVEAGKTVVAMIEPGASPMLDARGRALAEARRDVARANLDKAKAAHDFQVAELKRIRNLYTGRMATLQDFETAQWRETSAIKEVAAAESALRQAEVELAEFATAGPVRSGQAVVEVKAPTSGKVLRVVEESARPVLAGAPLVEIGDPADIEAIVTVLSRDGAAIAPGTPAELDHWGGGAPLPARVRYVEPAAFTKISALGVEEQRVNVVADILAPPEQRATLGDNYRIEGRIIVWQSERALKAPSGALVRRGSEWHAWVVRDGRARLRTVKVGRGSGLETQVLEGLAEGDEVILYPGDHIADGERVKPVQVVARKR
jgi:HlyD family secretion protein